MRDTGNIIAVCSILLATACASSKAGAPEATHAGAPAAATVAEAQIAAGAALYSANCAGCHGDAGEGTSDGPPVVGDGAFPLDPRPGQQRDTQFRTALDVFVWTDANMPPKNPGSIGDADLLAIMAFALSANGVELDADGLNGDSAALIVLNP